MAHSSSSLVSVSNSAPLYHGTLQVATDKLYLVNELLNGEHRAFYFSEMLAEMAEAKTQYVGSLELADYLKASITPPEFLRRLNQVGGNQALQETVKDLLYNNTFRYDLFVKGSRSLAHKEALESLGRSRVVLAGFEAGLPAKVVIKGVEVSLKPEIYQPLIDYLSRGPTILSEAAKATDLEFGLAAEAFTVMLALGWLHLGSPAADQQRLKRYNPALRKIMGSEMFSSVLTVNGGWLRGDFLETLYLLALMEEKDQAAYITELIHDHDWRPVRDGVPITDAAELKTYLEGQAAAMNEKLRPVYVRMMHG